MTTDNKAVTAYLPSDIEESLTRYCTESGITRKDKSGELKPSLGTGIVEILKIFFSGESVTSQLPGDVVTEDRLETALTTLLDELRSEFQRKYNSLAAQLESATQRMQELEHQPQTPSVVVGNKGLTDAELGKLLGVGRTTVNRWRHFQAQPQNPKMKEALKDWHTDGQRWFQR